MRDNVEDIEMVRQDEVADWMDTNDWDETDYVEIGRGVNADMVVAIDMDDFSTHESKTLLQGSSGCDDDGLRYCTRQQGSVPDTRSQLHISHIACDPDHRQRSTRFRANVHRRCCRKHIAKNFYDYNMAEDFARDGAAYAH